MQREALDAVHEYVDNRGSQSDKQQVRFLCAMREIDNLEKRRMNNRIVFDIGFILRTHGFIFEYTNIGWVLRPSNYLRHAEIVKRYPRRSDRARYYRARYMQKQWLVRQNKP